MYNASVMKKAARYQEFFEGVLEELRNRRPGIEWKVVDHSNGWNWVAVYRVKHNVWYGIGFTRDGKFRVDLHVGHKDSSRSQQLLQQLYSRRRIIEHALGFKVMWESPTSPDAKDGRLAVYQRGTIEEPPRRLAELRSWAIDMVISLRTALTGYLDELL